MNPPEPVRPLSGHDIAAEGPTASRGAELFLSSGAGAPGPTCVYFGGEQAVLIRREGRFALVRFHCSEPVLIPVEELVWA